MQYRQATGQRGQAAIMAIIFFVLISLIITGSMSLLVFSRLRAAEELVLSKKVYATSESGIEDVGYRMVHKKNPFNGPVISSPVTIQTTVNNGLAQLFINPPDANGVYSFNTSSSQVQNRYRRLNASVELESCKGVAFEQGVQAGFLGVKFANNFTLKHVDEGIPGNTERGDVFSNGPVNDGDNGINMWVSGNITTAQPTSLVQSETYDLATMRSVILRYMQSAFSDAPPATPVSVAIDSSRTDVAQSFIAPMTGYVTRVEIFASKVGNFTPNISVEIKPTQYDTAKPNSYTYPNTASNGYSRSSKIGVNGFDPSTWSSTGAWRSLNLNTNIPVIQNEKYWLVLNTNTGDNFNYYRLYTDPLNKGAYVPNHSCYGEIYCTSTLMPDPATSGNGLPDSYGSFVQTPSVGVADPTWSPHSTVGAHGDIAFRVYFGVESGNYTGYPERDYIPFAERVVAGEDILSYIIEESRAAGKITRGVDGNAVNSYAATTTAGAPPGSGATQCPLNAVGGGANCVLQTTVSSYPEPLELGVESDAEHTWEEAIYDMKQTALTVGTDSGGAPVTLSDTTKPYYIAPQTSPSHVTIADDVEVVLMGVSPTCVLPCNPYDPDGVAPAYLPGTLDEVTGAHHNSGTCVANLTGEPCFIWYIKGDLFLPDSCSIKTYPPNQKAFIVVDGTITIGNGGAQECTFTSTGGIYLISLAKTLLGSSSLDPNNTIKLLGNVGGDVILFAPLGEVYLSRKADTIAISAPRITVAAGTKVRYRAGAGSGASPSNSENSLRFRTYYEGE